VEIGCRDQTRHVCSVPKYHRPPPPSLPPSLLTSVKEDIMLVISWPTPEPDDCLQSGWGGGKAAGDGDVPGVLVMDVEGGSVGAEAETAVGESGRSRREVEERAHEGATSKG